MHADTARAAGIRKRPVVLRRIRRPSTTRRRRMCRLQSIVPGRTLAHSSRRSCSCSCVVAESPPRVVMVVRVRRRSVEPLGSLASQRESVGSSSRPGVEDETASHRNDQTRQRAKPPTEQTDEQTSRQEGEETRTNRDHVASLVRAACRRVTSRLSFVVRGRRPFRPD